MKIGTETEKEKKRSMITKMRKKEKSRTLITTKSNDAKQALKKKDNKICYCIVLICGNQ